MPQGIGSADSARAKAARAGQATSGGTGLDIETHRITVKGWSFHPTEEEAVIWPWKFRGLKKYESILAKFEQR
jgi:hypothetical protein